MTRSMRWPLRGRSRNRRPRRSRRFVLVGVATVSIGAPTSVGTLTTANRPPVLSSISPRTGRPGQTVTLSGRGFFSTDGVVITTFVGHPAPTRCPTRERCLVTVPRKPSGSYSVSLHTESGASNALSFTIVPTLVGPPTRTEVNAYSPFIRSGLAPGVRIVEQARGYCWTGSIVDKDAEAWRCFKGNLIYDPCFSSPYESSPGYVICHVYPPGVISSGDDALRLVLTKSLPRSLQDTPPSLEAGARWALTLSNGTSCILTSSLLAVTKSVDLTYSCASALAGALDKHVEPWSVQYLSSKGSSRLVVERVTRAWG